MPTRSEDIPDCPKPNQEWAARPSEPPRSVFKNYPGRVTAVAEPRGSGNAVEQQTDRDQTAEPLQTAIDVAVARCFLYRLLAQAYQDPTEKGWGEITKPSSLGDLESGVRVLAVTAPLLATTAALFRFQLKAELFESFLAAYLAAFGHAARGRCPLNEIEYGDIKADPLFQPHRLADIAAFYRAFGVEVAEDADERHDHICLELEFMCVLAAKEAYALEHQLEAEVLILSRDAQRRFLREHLGRWTPAFARRLARMAADTPLESLANFTRAFIEAECARFGAQAGSDDILLRPVDEAVESMCHSCDVAQTPSGALQSTAGSV